MQSRFGAVIKSDDFIRCNDRSAFQLRKIDVVFCAEVFDGVDSDLRRLTVSLFPTICRGEADA